MDDAIDFVPGLQVGKRAGENLGRQSPQPLANLLEKLTTGLAIPLTEAVKQRLKLTRGRLVHTGTDRNLLAQRKLRRFGKIPPGARPNMALALLSLVGASVSRKQAAAWPT